MTQKPPMESLLYLGLSLAAIAGIVLGMPEPSAMAQTFALALGVALIGLPHGALDPLLASRAGLLKNRRAITLFHGAYLAAAALMLAFWLVAPIFALLIFLLYSAHHFAGDWQDRPFARRLALGASILSLPAMLHVGAVGDIYVLLSGDGARAIAEAQLWLAPLWLLIIGAAITLALWHKRVWHALELAILVFSALLLPPLVFFLVYFCALHSPRHFLAIWRASPDQHQAARIAGGYTLASVLIAFTAILAFGGAGDIVASLQRVTFIGLAALTLPHMILTTILEGRPRD